MVHEPLGGPTETLRGICGGVYGGGVVWVGMGVSPTRRMLHDVIIFVPFFTKIVLNYLKTNLFHIFPWKGTLTLMPGMGVVCVCVCVGGHLGPKTLQITNNHKTNSSSENCSHFWDNFQTMSNISLKHVPIYRKRQRIR